MDTIPGIGQMTLLHWIAPFARENSGGYSTWLIVTVCADWINIMNGGDSGFECAVPAVARGGRTFCASGSAWTNHVCWLSEQAVRFQSSAHLQVVSQARKAVRPATGGVLPVKIAR